MDNIIPEPPKLFFCTKCKVYFYSYSELNKPTHVKCHGHATRKATEKEIQWVKEANGN